MISHTYKCIFIHIPKTAGQSIEHFFLNLHGLSWENRAPLLLRYNPDPLKGPESLAHLTAEEYTKLGHISSEKFKNYFKFAFVRNPWARLVSEYRYRSCYKKYTFKEFVLERLPKQDAYSDKYRHIMPQYDFIHDRDGKIIVDFVGRFENLQEDFQTVLQKLSIPTARLPRMNVSLSKDIEIIKKIKYLLFRKTYTAQKHWKDYYDRDTAEIVRKIYSQDIKKFNYSLSSL